MNQKPRIIAEFCQNHNGHFDTLRRMIDAAAGAGATHGKIQTIFADDLSYREEYMPERIHGTPAVGRICGMYATCNGTGGIIPIETSWMPSETLFSLSMTGNLGKVMQESTKVASTLAWSLVAPPKQEELRTRWTTHKQGAHVHCPEGAMKKEGPSAGTALTTALVSLLTQNPIRNDVAITGEINLSGEVSEIGGLREKMYGAKQAGCALILYPAANKKSMDKIVRECPDLLAPGHFEARAVSTIHEVLEIALVSKDHITPPPTAVRADGDMSSTAPAPPAHSGASIRHGKRGRRPRNMQGGMQGSVA